MLPVFGRHSEPSHSGAVSAHEEPGQSLSSQPDTHIEHTVLVLPYMMACS